MRCKRQKKPIWLVLEKSYPAPQLKRGLLPVLWLLPVLLLPATAATAALSKCTCTVFGSCVYVLICFLICGLAALLRYSWGVG
jgi:hypothetical protein